MKIMTLFSRFGTEKYKDADLRLRTYLSRRLRGVQRDFILTDTSLPENYEQVEKNFTVLGASNTHWEFSGWTRALRYLGNRVLSYDYVQIVTSAFEHNYIDFHSFLSKKMLQLLTGRAVALGHLEAYNTPVMFQNVRFQAWLRSSYIFMPSSEIYMLHDLYSVKEPEAIFSEGPKEPFCAHAPLCEQYKSYLISWLTGDGTGQGTKWHSRFTLNEDTYPFFKAKALAIMNEMTLSNRLTAQGCSLVDMTWLKSAMDAKRHLTTIPSWHEQITQRGTGHESILEG